MEIMANQPNLDGSSEEPREGDAKDALDRPSFLLTRLSWETQPEALQKPTNAL